MQKPRLGNSPRRHGFQAPVPWLRPSGDGSKAARRKKYQKRTEAVKRQTAVFEGSPQALQSVFLSSAFFPGNPPTHMQNRFSKFLRMPPTAHFRLIPGSPDPPWNLSVSHLD